MYLLVFHFPRQVHKISIFRATQHSLAALDMSGFLPGYTPNSQSYGFSSSHIWMWKLDCKEDWVPKNWFFWTVVLEKTWELLGQQGDQTSQYKDNQPWIFIGRTDIEAEAPVLCVCVCVTCSVVSNSLQPHGLSMEFSRQECWSGLPFPSPGDPPDPGIKLGSSVLQADFFLTTWATREATDTTTYQTWIRVLSFQR